MNSLSVLNALQRETSGKFVSAGQAGYTGHAGHAGQAGYTGHTGHTEQVLEEDTKNYDRYIAHLHLMLKADILNSVQYTYFKDFANIDGTLINVRYFIDEMHNMMNTVESEYSEELEKSLVIDSCDEFDVLKNLKEYWYPKQIDRSIQEIDLILEEVLGQDVESGLTKSEHDDIMKAMKARIRKLNLIKKFETICANLFNKYLKYDKKNSEFRINKTIRYGMTRVDTIDFTTEQKSGLWAIYNFLVDPEASSFCFKGYAGTGKTTTIVELVSYLIKNQYIQNVAFTAPTNKAVNVIKNKFRPHLRSLVKHLFDKDLEDNFCFDDEIGYLEIKNVKIHFITIHKLLMFKTDYSISGEMIFVRDHKSESLISEYDLVMVDECSMINMDMIDSIFCEIKALRTGKSSKYKRKPKIMFTGDPAQLPPVNEETSSIFSKSRDDLTFDDYATVMNFKIMDIVISDSMGMLQHKYEALMAELTNMNSFLLTNVVRSRLDNVTKVCNEFRHLVVKRSYDMTKLSANLKSMIEKKVDQPGTIIDSDRMGITGVCLYQYLVGQSRLATPWFKKFLRSVKRGDTAIILTWTNRQTDTYNDVIRRKIFRRKKTISKFEIGDILMLSEFYSLDLGEDFVSQRLFTSEQIKVVKTQVQDVTLRAFEAITTKIYTNMKIYPKVNPEFDMLIKYMNDNLCKDKKVRCWFLEVYRLGEDESKSMAIVVLDDKDKLMFDQCKSTANDMIRNFGNKLLNRYKMNSKQIEKNIIKPMWIQWRKIYDEPFASVNYGYSITTHKAQGSSFQDVYVDLSDILQNPRMNEGYKCAYTAVTRASNELHILI